MIENVLLSNINFAYGDSSFFEEILPYAKTGNSPLIEFDLSKFHEWFAVFEKNIEDFSHITFAVPIPDKPEPMMQFMGFKFIRLIDPPVKLNNFDMTGGRTKENYMKFQTLMIEEDYGDYSFIDTKFINELDRLYNFTLEL